MLMLMLVIMLMLMPVCARVCVCHQARAGSESAWATLEYRFDRVHQTFSRSVFSEVRNLCCMRGDAKQVLPRHVRSDSVSAIFVNHPEPPQQNGAAHSSQADHLLTLVCM